MVSTEPIAVSGPKTVPLVRDVVWKNVCLIGDDSRECIVEMSYTKTKFYIVALDLETNRYNVIELFRPQANKIIKACTSLNGAKANDFQHLMTYLQFKYGKLCIKDMDLLLQYQLYMSPERIREQSQKEL